MKALTSVASVASATEPGLHRVSGAVGLHLQIGESGGKSWVYRYRLHGSRRLMGLGSVDKVSLAEARKLAVAAANLRHQGIDPIEARRAERAALAEAARPKPAPKVHAFREVATAYLDHKSAEWKSRNAARALRCQFDRWVHPTLGKMDVADVQIEDVARALTAASGAVPETARRLRGHIKAILDMAAVLGYRDRNAPNPAALELLKYKWRIPDCTVQHFPAASLDDAPAIFRRIHEAEGTVFRAVELTLLTTTRPGTALRAAWSEIDCDKMLWVIPAERMKTGKEFTVPLVPAAMAVLKAQERVRSTGNYIFPGRVPGHPLSYNVFQTCLSQKLGITGVSLHGFRSVFRDWAGDIADVPRDVAEAQLAHALGATEGSYRRLTAIEKRREVLERYAAWLLGGTASNVVVLRPAAVA